MREQQHSYVELDSEAAQHRYELPRVNLLDFIAAEQIRERVEHKEDRAIPLNYVAQRRVDRRRLQKPIATSWR